MTIRNHENNVSNSNLSLESKVLSINSFNNTSKTNEKIVRLNYSENLFASTFQYSDSLMIDLKKKLDVFRMHDVRISKLGNNITNLYCMSCNHVVFQRNSLLVKHIMIEHCNIDPVYLKVCLKFTRFDPDFNLLPDKNMLKSVTQKRLEETNVISVTDSDERELSPDKHIERDSKPNTLDGNTNKNTIEKHNVDKEKIYLKYSESVLLEYWNHLSSEELSDLKRKMNKFRRCSIRTSLTDSNRFFCNECEIMFDLCYNKIGKHVLLNHCGISRNLIDDLMILATVDDSFQLISEKEMIKKINGKRREHSSKPENKGLQNKEIKCDSNISENSLEIPIETGSNGEHVNKIDLNENNNHNNTNNPNSSLISLKYSKVIFSKCFKHIDQNIVREIRRKMRKYETCAVSKYGIMHSRFLCNECKLVTCLTIDKSLKHILVDHCKIPIEFLHDILILTSVDNDKHQLIPDKEMMERINEERLKSEEKRNYLIVDNEGELESEQSDDSSSFHESNNSEIIPTISSIKSTKNKPNVTTKYFKKENIIQLDYSERVFTKCFQHISSEEMISLKEKLDNFRKFSIRRNGVKRVRYICNHCNDMTTVNITKLLKHVLICHCSVTNQYIEELEIITSLNKELQLASDDIMIRKINRTRLKSQKNVLPQLEDSENESSNNICQSDIEVLRKLPFNYSKDIFEKCFNHLSEKDFNDLQSKLEIVKECIMTRICENEDDKYYQCNKCCTFRHYTKAHNNFQPLRKHILKEHCRISEDLIEQCILLIGNKSSFTEEDEKQIITCMEKIRAKEKLKTSEKKEKISNDEQIKSHCSIIETKLSKKRSLSRNSNSDDDIQGKCKIRKIDSVNEISIESDNENKKLSENFLINKTYENGIITSINSIKSNGKDNMDKLGLNGKDSMGSNLSKGKDSMGSNRSNEKDSMDSNRSNEKNSMNSIWSNENDNMDNIRSKGKYILRGKLPQDEKIYSPSSTKLSKKRSRSGNSKSDDDILGKCKIRKIDSVDEISIESNNEVKKDLSENLSVNEHVIDDKIYNSVVLLHDLRCDNNCKYFNDNSLETYSNNQISSLGLNDEVVDPNKFFEQIQEVIEVSEGKERYSNTSNDLNEEIHEKSIEEEYEFSQDFYFDYSESLLKILCSVEMKFEFYQDIISHLESLVDMKHKICKITNTYIYQCSNCQFRFDCPYDFTKHVILNHTAIPDHLKPIAENCVIVPIIDQP